MRILFILLFSTTLSFGQQTIYDTITSGGLQRNFILYVPASYSVGTSVPLLFNFHGYTSNALQQMYYGNFRSIADTAGFIIVHPNGTLDVTSTTHFNVGWGGSTVDDVGFAEDLIDSIAAAYNIDLSRVYSTGMSNGGYMSYHLACMLNHKIAAVASVTGSMSPYTYNNCNPVHPTPVLQIHGTADGTVLYAGTSFGEHIDTVMNYWSTYNNCTPTGDTSSLPDIDSTDGSTVSQIVYDSGYCNSSTELLRVAGGAHTWPGAAFPLAGTNYDIDASLKVWQFLSQYSLSNLNCITSVNAIEEPVSELKIYPNPANNYIIIESENSMDSEYVLISVMGQIIKTGRLHDHYTEINLSDVNPGLYFIKAGNKSYKIEKIR